jgi:hypothetical protein
MRGLSGPQAWTVRTADHPASGPDRPPGSKRCSTVLPCSEEKKCNPPISNLKIHKNNNNNNNHSKSLFVLSTLGMLEMKPHMKTSELKPPKKEKGDKVKGEPKNDETSKHIKRDKTHKNQQDLKGTRKGQTIKEEKRNYKSGFCHVNCTLPPLPIHGELCRCFGSDRTPGVAPQGVLGVGRCRRL